MTQLLWFLDTNNIRLIRRTVLSQKRSITWIKLAKFKIPMLPFRLFSALCVKVILYGFSFMHRSIEPITCSYRVRSELDQRNWSNRCTNEKRKKNTTTKTKHGSIQMLIRLLCGCFRNGTTVSNRLDICVVCILNLSYVIWADLVHRIAQFDLNEWWSLVLRMQSLFIIC